MVHLILSCGCLFAVLAFFPDPSDIPTTDEPAALPLATGRLGDVAAREMLIVSCVVLFVLRSFVVSGVEVGSALLLERDFGIDRRLVGVAIGFTFIVVLPVK